MPIERVSGVPVEPPTKHEPKLGEPRQEPVKPAKEVLSGNPKRKPGEENAPPSKKFKGPLIYRKDGKAQEEDEVGGNLDIKA